MVSERGIEVDNEKEKREGVETRKTQQEREK